MCFDLDIKYNSKHGSSSVVATQLINEWQLLKIMWSIKL